MTLRLVIFDVNETLFSLQAIRRRLPAEGDLELWFTQVLRDGFALAAAGDARPFRDLALLHLERLLGERRVAAPREAAEDILAAFTELDPHPDVAPALERLRAAGLRLVTLTNGHAETTQRLLARAGLAEHIEHCLSVDAVGHWKPRPEPYRYALEVCGVTPDEAAMVAVHSWDVDGAKRAGLVTGYASRLEGAFLPLFTAPDVIGKDLVEVAESLLARA